MSLAFSSSDTAAVTIGHLSIRPSTNTYPDPWVCVFPREIQRVGLTRPQLTLWGELTASVGQLSDRGVVLFRSSDLDCYVYPHKMKLLGELAELGILRKAGLGLWAVNPRYLWAGPLKQRSRSVEQWDLIGHSSYQVGG